MPPQPRYRAVLLTPRTTEEANSPNPPKPVQTLHPTRGVADSWADLILKGVPGGRVEVYETTETLVGTFYGLDYVAPTPRGIAAKGSE